MAIPLAVLMPLITTGLGIAYEAIWGAPGRARLAREERERREREYQRWLAEYQRFLESPIIAYPPEAIETAMRGIEETLAKQMAEIRPRMLEEIAARGVRGAGIAEYPLSRLEEQRLRTISEARRALELERLLAERQARMLREQQRAQFLAAQMGAAFPQLEAARQFEFMQPLYSQQILSQLLGMGGLGLAYALAQRPGTTAGLPYIPYTPTSEPTLPTFGLSPRLSLIQTLTSPTQPVTAGVGGAVTP